MSVNVFINKGIAYIKLENPPLNLLSNRVKQDIKSTFQSLGVDKNVRVILFEAEGGNFSGGADLKEFNNRLKDKKAKDAWIDGHEMLLSIMRIPQPSIVCVKGNALGGGAELVSAFDIRLFAENVSYGFPEVSRAVFPGNGGFERIFQLIGEANIPYLMLTGEKINTEDCLRLGIANKMVKEKVLELEGRKIAQLLASYSYPTIKTIKKSINNYKKGDSFLQIGMYDFISLHETEDIKESVNAFFEKRNPNYQHK